MRTYVANTIRIIAEKYIGNGNNYILINSTDTNIDLLLQEQKKNIIIKIINANMMEIKPLSLIHI